MKRLSVLAFTAVLLSGCGNPDAEAPYVSLDSTFTCAQLNNSDALGDGRTSNAILTSAVQQLDSAYVEDTAIQRFYRGLVRRNLDYALQHHKETLQACNGHSDKGVNEAATDALNAIYARMMKAPRWATCTAYLAGEVDMDGVIQEMQHPTVVVMGGDAAARQTLVVYSTKEYGPDYLQREVTAQCKAAPDKRLWNVFSNVSTPVVEQIYRQASEAAEAELKKKNAEAKAARLAKYSKSLYADGPAQCDDFQQQIQLASNTSDEDNPVFMAGLQATLADMPRPEKPYQREAFEQALKTNLFSTLLVITNHCIPGMAPEAALMETYFITEAKAP
ncbi:hypothetical protein [Pseudomonas aeruginosa]|uniref:hypothetical protein n=1 Tax=Pseudomonas aeruginosa TaxID=287 RepID=UPI0031B6EFD3